MFNLKSFTFNPITENTYILYNESRDCIIIDPGCYDVAEKNQLYDFIDKYQLRPVILLNTHCHLDHVFGNKDVAEKYDLTLRFHPLDKPTFDLAPTSGVMYGLPFDQYQGTIDWLEEGEIIRLGDDELEVILTPGHSPGSVCFYCKKDKFVIGGDVLFQRSIGRWDLPGGDGTLLLKSIRKKLLILPDDVVVYPGHGPATTIGEERAHNPFLNEISK